MNIKEIREKKEKELQAVGRKIEEDQKALGELQAEALRLDGALNQLKELEEGE